VKLFLITRSLAVFLLVINAASASAQPTAQAVLPGAIHLTDSVACTSVKDQSQSPTCWVFGTNSLFESDFIRKYHRTLNLSEMFIARYAYIDKARQWLATKGKTYFAGGGQFHDVIRVVNKYGMVPEEVYRGKPNEESSHNHTRLDTAMKRFTEELLRQGKTELDDEDLRQMNDTLDRYVGKVPGIFWYNKKQYTPGTFAAEVVHFTNDYVEVASFDDYALCKQFVLEDKYNWARDSFYNLTIDDMQMLVGTALAKGWSVGWEGDVTEPGFNSFGGYASIDTVAKDYGAERLSDYQTEKTERDHVLHIVGIGKDENNGKWYYMKNSWGTWFSKYKGYLFMNENYFKLKTVILMVNKEGLPQSLKKRLGLN
jgi:bleomycin hydrolase